MNTSLMSTTYWHIIVSQMAGKLNLAVATISGDVVWLWYVHKGKALIFMAQSAMYN